MSSQTGAPRPAFQTQSGGPIFPATTWWITDAGGQKQPPSILEFDDAKDDDEEEEDDDKHEAEDADDSCSDDEKANDDVAVGDLALSQEQQTQSALADHTPTLGWRTSRSSGNLHAPAPPLPPLVYAGYFERQLQSRCGMHALNNALGQRHFTVPTMRAACDRYLAMFPSEVRADNEKPSGWYSMNVMVLAVEAISKPLAARHERYYDLRWEPLFRNPGVIHQCVGAVANLRQQHWVALRSVEGQIWRLDSLDPAPKSMTELDYSWFIRANRGTYPIFATDKDGERMALAETCSTTASMEDTLVESPAGTLQTEATAGSSCGNSLLTATQADSTTPPTTQPAASEELPQYCLDPSPEKRGRVDGGPPCLAIAEQISPVDAQQLIVDAFNRRAFEMSLGVDSRGDAREGRAPPSTACGEVDVEMVDDAMEVDEGPACLAVAEQISVEDARDMIMECFNQRASEMEREELEAKASFMAALATRGGN